MLVFFDYAAAAFALFVAALIMLAGWSAFGRLRLWLQLQKIERQAKRDAADLAGWR